MSHNDGWIGFDFDGTIAEDHDYPGLGNPVDSVVQRAKNYLRSGETVKIFTARASEPEQVAKIKQWTKKHLGRNLEVTNKKDRYLKHFYDDKARQVKNGKVIGEDSIGE